MYEHGLRHVCAHQALLTFAQERERARQRLSRSRRVARDFDNYPSSDIALTAVQEVCPDGNRCGESRGYRPCLVGITAHGLRREMPAKDKLSASPLTQVCAGNFEWGSAFHRQAFLSGWGDPLLKAMFNETLIAKLRSKKISIVTDLCLSATFPPMYP